MTQQSVDAHHLQIWAWPFSFGIDPGPSEKWETLGWTAAVAGTLSSTSSRGCRAMGLLHTPPGHSVFQVCSVLLWVGKLLSREGSHPWLWWPWWVPWWVSVGTVWTVTLSHVLFLHTHPDLGRVTGSFCFTDWYLMAPQWNLSASH